MPTSSHKPGKLVISLDFELYWGVRDVLSLDSYRDHLLGVRTVIPRLLDLFGRYGIRATWATVGFLFFDNKNDLLASLPRQLPRYADERLSPYGALDRIGPNEAQDPFHFGWSLIEQIREAEGQEIASHTFSHYYCREPGQDAMTFAEDLAAAVSAAAHRGLKLESLVFPRNQVEPAYLPLCAQQGITAYRGNRPVWFERPRSARHESQTQRAVRLADSYVPVTRSRLDVPEAASVPCDVPATRFLRPYDPRRRYLDGLKLRRICGELSHAAAVGGTYHLWWHPHNFGVHTRENLELLSRILDHFVELCEVRGMRNVTMREAATQRIAEIGRGVAATP